MIFLKELAMPKHGRRIRRKQKDDDMEKQFRMNTNLQHDPSTGDIEITCALEGDDGVVFDCEINHYGVPDDVASELKAEALSSGIMIGEEVGDLNKALLEWNKQLRALMNFNRRQCKKAGLNVG